jgi:hypothetical protein
VNTRMPAATPYLQRVSELLARVLALTDKVISERVGWKASPAEWDFLLEARVSRNGSFRRRRRPIQVRSSPFCCSYASALSPRYERSGTPRTETNLSPR